ncbi:MAG: hypothetical protein WA364_15405 [Candidatus Nitrosopolaris sp.]
MHQVLLIAAAHTIRLQACLGYEIMTSLYTNYYPHEIMLGDQIAELKGKLTGQRVLDVEGPTMETSVDRGKL